MTIKEAWDMGVAWLQAKPFWVHVAVGFAVGAVLF